MREAILSGAVLFLLSASSWAQDMQTGARAKGMGGSYTAFEDDPVAIWLNPAGISRQGWKLAVHFQTFTQYELERGNGFVGTTGEAEAGLTDPPVVPSFVGAVFPLGEKTKHALAIALVRPFENRLTYDFPAPPAVVAQTEQQFWRFRVAYAHDFTLGEEASFFPHLSVGVAVDAGYTRYELDSFSSSGVVIDALKDTNVQPGFAVGLFTTVYDGGDTFRLDLGAAFQSGIDFKLQADEATFAFWDWPPMLTWGVAAYFLDHALRVTLDMQWVGWDIATEDSDDPDYPSFENTLSFSIGVEYQIKISDEVSLLPRAGYRRWDAPWSDENNLPSISLTKVSIDTKDEAFHIFTFGLGVRWEGDTGKGRGVDVGVEVGGDAANFSLGYTHSY